MTGVDETNMHNALSMAELCVADMSESGLAPIEIASALVFHVNHCLKMHGMARGSRAIWLMRMGHEMNKEGRKS